MSYHVTSCHITSCYITYHITSYHNMSHYITSYCIVLLHKIYSTISGHYDVIHCAPPASALNDATLCDLMVCFNMICDDMMRCNVWRIGAHGVEHILQSQESAHRRGAGRSSESAPSQRRQTRSTLHWTVWSHSTTLPLLWLGGHRCSVGYTAAGGEGQRRPGARDRHTGVIRGRAGCYSESEEVLHVRDGVQLRDRDRHRCEAS